MQTKREFEEFLDKLRQSSEGKMVLVEGMKDKKALESLGVKNIMTLKKPLYAVIEDIVSSGKECIILTDLDKQGKKIYAQISSKLKQFGVKIDDSFRNFLFKTKLRQIEGIVSYLEKLM